MDQVPPAKFCADFSAGDCLTVFFCLPCVYGSGLAKNARYQRTGKNAREGLFPDTISECAVVCGSIFIGSIVPCFTGIYLRSIRPGATEDVGSAFLAEWCGLCSCAPCQMNQFRMAGGDVAANLL